MATIIREQRSGLSTLTRRPEDSSSETKQGIILLHGWGADGEDMMGLSHSFAPLFPNAVFLAPDGPEPCSANPLGRQWFALDVDQQSIDKGVEKPFPTLVDFVDGVRSEFKLSASSIFLIGFSQGGMMALHLGGCYAECMGGVISFSGALLAPDKVATRYKNKPPVLLVHGDEDVVVPPSALTIAEAVLSQAGFSVEAIKRQGLGHGIDQESLEAALNFLKTQIKST